MPLTVAESLALNDVLIDMEASSKKHVLELLSEHLSGSASGLDRDAVFEALIERERLGCTAADFGLAMPHARLATASAPVGVFARLKTAVDFDSQDAPHVDLLFCFVLPLTTSERHDIALQGLAARMMTQPVCDALRSADDATEILAILRACAAVDDGDKAAGGLS